MKTAIAGILVALATLGGAGAIADDSAPPLVVIAMAKVKPGSENAFRSAAARILAPTRDESGNISYAFYQGTGDSTEFATHETWKTQADIDAHMASPHMQQFFQEVGPLFEAGYPVIKTYKKFEN